MEATSIRYRHGEAGDLEAITRLYNHYIRTSPCTFDTEPMASRADWFAKFRTDGPHQLFVAVADGQLLGYACSGTFKDKLAYATSAEVSVYVSANATGLGIGHSLYEQLFASLETAPLHQLFAGITLPNDASLRLHQRLGFTHCGTFPEAGFKFGQFWDVAWLVRQAPGRGNR